MARHWARRENVPTVFACCIELSRRRLFSVEKMCEAVTSSYGLNPEDFLIAEANHVHVWPSTRCDLPRDAPCRCKRQPRQRLLGELATITDVTVLQMAHGTDHQRTKRFDTVVPEIRPCSPSMNSRTKSSGVKRLSTAPT